MSGRDCYISIEEWEIYSGKIELIYFVIESGRRLAIEIKF
jgi:hypothetical protein